MKPYTIRREHGYCIVIDSRTDQPVSYPTNSRQARAERDLLNEGYAKEMAS